MFVKICGLTNLEDTLAAVEMGAQAVGFNFVRSSPRYIAPDALGHWVESVPAHVWRVGVFADEAAVAVERLASRMHLDVAQLHGRETPGDIPKGVRVWKAARVGAGFDVGALAGFDVEALLLDGPASGVTFNWEMAAGQARKLVLAGGLDAENVREAIGRVRPWGVDVCSRIESEPGRKDHAAMRRFVETVMSC